MKTAFKIVGINIIFIVIGAVTLEAIFGNWIFGPQYGFLNIPRNTMRHFDVSAVYGGGRIQYTREEHGLRGDFLNPADIDVLVIGGSTTNELYIDDAETWVAKLQALFSANEQHFVFANAGVDGHSTAGHLKSFEAWFPKISGMSPKIVLAYVGINDAALVESDETLHDTMIDPDPVRRWRHFIMNNSALYNAFRKLRGILLADRTHLAHRSAGLTNAVWKFVDDPYRNSDLIRQRYSHFDAYRKRLRALASAINRLGAAPVFITQKNGMYKTKNGKLFTRYAFDKEGWKAADYVILSILNDITRESCEQLSLHCVDLARDLEFKDTDFYDTVHTTPAGSARIARYLFRELRRIPFFAIPRKTPLLDRPRRPGYIP